MKVVDAAAAGGRVAAQSAVGDRERRAAGRLAVAVDAAAGAGRVAAQGAVGDRERGVIVLDAAAEQGRVAAQGAVGDGQRGVKVVDAAAFAAGYILISIHDGQPVNGDIGARADLKYAKGRRAASGAALKRRSVAVDNQLMAAVAADHRQAVGAIDGNGESVSAIGRQLDRVVLAISVGCVDGHD